MRMNQQLDKLRQWLTLGIGVKRWLLLILIGLLLFAFGVALLLVELTALFPTATLTHWLTLAMLPLWLRVALPLLGALTIIGYGLLQLSNWFLPRLDLPEGGMTSLLQKPDSAERGPSIVVIGGGTGMPGVLRGLRSYTRNITAIVTVADDGGSSGRLRREFGLLPPGDFRNNIAALSRDEALMTKMLQYRFGANVTLGGDSELRGHAFGNLLLAALTGITGSFDEALLAAEKVLAMRGRVLPSTLADVTLVAEIETESGELERVVGESRIPEVNGRIEKLSLHPESARAYPPALKAIFQADLIVMGPGSLYTSILPNLLVPDITEALRRAKAPKLYVCNLATQPGETDNYSVADHVATIFHHIPTDCVNIVLANSNLSIPQEQGGGQTVYVQPTPPQHAEMVLADLVDEKRPWRHDSHKLSRAIWQIINT